MKIFTIINIIGEVIFMEFLDEKCAAYLLLLLYINITLILIYLAIKNVNLSFFVYTFSWRPDKN